MNFSDNRAEYFGCFYDNSNYMPVKATTAADQPGKLTTQVINIFFIKGLC